VHHAVAHGVDLREAPEGALVRVGERSQRQADGVLVVGNGRALPNALDGAARQHAILTGGGQLRAGLDQLILDRGAAAVENQNLHLDSACRAVMMATL